MSLQSRLLRLVLRATVKKPLAASAGDRAAFVRIMRRSFERSSALAFPVPRNLRVVAVDTPAVRGEWVLPRETPFPPPDAWLYVHGGGLVAGAPRGYRMLTFALARITRTAVFVVDYRLAPEHRFPAALDDVVAAYEALRARVPAGRILIAGDSAGGSLALAALLALRARGLTQPAGVVALSPWTDLAGGGASLAENRRSDDMLVETTGDARLALAYADEAALREPLVSPLYGDYAGGPPLLVFASTIEILRDDATRLVARARAQGVDAALVLEPDMPHVWPIFTTLPEARRALRTMRDFALRCRAAQPGAA